MEVICPGSAANRRWDPRAVAGVLRRDVTRNSIGPLPIAVSTEVDLLAAIRLLAVREENPKVARVALSDDAGPW